MRKFDLLTVGKVLLAVALFAVVGCSTFDETAKVTIVSTNEFQDAAKNAFNEAKATTEKAGKECGAIAREQVPPVIPSLEACKALGVPIPYDPVALNKLAGPINAAYEAIRGAQAARLLYKEGKGSKTNVIAAMGLALEAVARFTTAANDAGVKIDTKPFLEIRQKWETVQ